VPGSGGDGASTPDPAGPTAPNPVDDGFGEPVLPFEPTSALASLRKVKNLLVGLPPTGDEIALLGEPGAPLTEQGVSALRSLIGIWTSDAELAPLFRDKMLFFFRNTFQQVGFTPTEDFKPQLLENGGFDFGPLGYIEGSDAFARLVKNLEDSFALTAWQLVEEGRPFSETLTTTRFMMTTALKSLYLQIEKPNDQPFNFAGNQAERLAWRVDLSGRVIPLETTLDPNSADYLVFSDVRPANLPRFELQPTCVGTTLTTTDSGYAEYTGYAQLFQRLLGFTPRYPFAATPECWEHASEPYFTTEDSSDWQWVTIRPLAAGDTNPEPYDLPALRQTTELALNLPRVGFFTTPAFLALWSTNDSNQHRVTANQTLLVALQRTLTPDALIIPITPLGLDAEHSVEGSACFACHKNLDPLRQFWESHFDFNDRNDFPTSTFGGAIANPKPTETGGVLALGNVNQEGATLYDLGPLLLQVTTGSDAPVSLFAVSMAQNLCFYANSTGCLERDPEFRRIASAFEVSNYDFSTLINELFSSPLVTGAATTETFSESAPIVSITRRDHLCAALAARLGRADVCALGVPQPDTTQGATLRIATSVAADAFSRGSETPVTPSRPSLFYRAATEQLCENIAAQVVDSESDPIFTSDDVPAAITDLVVRVVGYPTTDPLHAEAARILQEHHDAALAETGVTATQALHSTFVLACEAPTALGVGL
jgi:hypothetical protein